MSRNAGQRGRLACTTCGLDAFRTASTRNRHKLQHRRAACRPFGCGICGIFVATAVERNKHETSTHHFERSVADKKRPEGIQMTPEQLAELRNLGTNFAEVQRSAVPSAALVGTSGPERGRRLTRSQAARRAPPEVISLSDSEDEVETPLPTAPAAAQPASGLVALQRPPDYRPRSLDRTAEFSRLFGLLVFNPTIVYYDFLRLDRQFSLLPIRLWLKARESTLLFLRLATRQSTAPAGLGVPRATFAPNDQFGEVHLFCKWTGHPLADRFAPLAAERWTGGSFAQFMAEVRQLDERTVVVADELDRPDVWHLQAERFVVF
ncbi:hypothetical protein M3Y99_00734800 [Aphelenchoides fujianensis]|nr:hypothetical protein M3Y99_00734800 [Aphelenchoides fujianensis]